MKRVIKFRAWDGEKMRYEFSVQANGDGINCAGEIMTGWVLMQFTGLRDKHGVGIYEGDIVRSEAFHGSVEATMYEQKMKRQGKTVDWMKLDVIMGHPQGHYIMRPLNDLEDMTYVGNSLPGKCAFESDYEVVGTVYENPSLFSKEQNDKRIVATEDHSSTDDDNK